LHSIAGGEPYGDAVTLLGTSDVKTEIFIAAKLTDEIAVCRRHALRPLQVSTLDE
jgi:hypothetical protein